MENVKVTDSFVDEKTGIEYIKQGDYYLPNLVLDPEETNYTIGKYGRMKLNYLKNHKKAEYIILFMDGKLNRYLQTILCYNPPVNCRSSLFNLFMPI